MSATRRCRAGSRYDSVGRLTRVDTASSTVRRIDYLHDKNGNRTAVENRSLATDVSPSATSTYARTAGTNRLASVTTPSGTRAINYDGRGNTSSETRGASVNVSVAYDGHGRLTSYARTGEVTQGHVYNGLDDRVSTSRGTDTRRFVYDSMGRVLAEFGASAADVKAEFIWLHADAANDPGSGSGAGNQPFGGGDGVGGYAPLAVVVPGATAGTTVLNWVHGNHLGVPILTTDSSGASVTPYGYNAPGFPGQSQTHADLYYNRHRDYDPTLGRYIQADPIGLAGGANLYQYAGGNPVRYVDPNGLSAMDTFCEWMPTTCSVAQKLKDALSPPRPPPPPPNQCPIDEDEDDRCEIQYEADIGRCTKAIIKYGRNGFTQCASSALRRRGQCKKNQPLEPLTGVDRPLYWN